MAKDKDEIISGFEDVDSDVVETNETNNTQTKLKNSFLGSLSVRHILEFTVLVACAILVGINYSISVNLHKTSDGLAAKSTYLYDELAASNSLLRKCNQSGNLIEETLATVPLEIHAINEAIKQVSTQLGQGGSYKTGTSVNADNSNKLLEMISTRLDLQTQHLESLLVKDKETQHIPKRPVRKGQYYIYQGG